LGHDRLNVGSISAFHAKENDRINLKSKYINSIMFLQVSMLPTRGEKSSGDLNILAIMQNAATIHEIRHLLLPRPFVPHN
jgi:hypothetical protein